MITALTTLGINFVRSLSPEYHLSGMISKTTAALRGDTPIWRVPALLIALLLLGGCVYELDVQQGNKLEPADVEKIEPGMTRSQVRFVLGTPVIGDTFHTDRWDYLYYLKPGRSDNVERRWLIVWFDGDVVREIQRDVRTEPT